jgi:predicted RecB family nuclease
MRKVTASDIDNFQKCSRKVWLKFFEKDVEPAKASGFLKYLADRGNNFEKECIDSLDEYFEPVSFDETIKLMEKGVKYIYQAVLEDEKRIGKPDLLRRNDSGSSKFGDYFYEIIDIKSASLYSDLKDDNLSKFVEKSKTLQKNYGLQLYHYFDLLNFIQDYKPNLFLWVCDRVGFNELKFEDSVINKFRYSASLEEVYFGILDGVLDLVENSEVEAFKVSACDTCEWNNYCMDVLIKNNHCSLIAGVQKRGEEDLKSLGINSISDFYEKVDLKTKIKYVLTGNDTLKTHRLRKQAQALIENKEFYLGDTLKPFDVDYLLFYDIEGEMGHEFEYLHGVWEVNKNTGEKKYISFITSKADEEVTIWNEFLSYVKEISKKGSFRIIYFADYERVAWKNLSLKAETCERDLNLLLKNSTDILKEWIDKKLILPRYNYSIKTVAPYYGFVWECKENVYADENGKKFKLDEANGGESIAWLDYWLSGKEHFKKIILDYNRDDCIGTEFVYNKLLELYGEKK